MREIQLNCQYHGLFLNFRVIQQIILLARQTGLNHLPAAYDNATAKPFQSIFIDMRPGTSELLRLRSHVMPEQYMKIYVKKSANIPCRKALNN